MKHATTLASEYIHTIFMPHGTARTEFLNTLQANENNADAARSQTHVQRHHNITKTQCQNINKQAYITDM
jgi:hypothetical protein